MVLFPMLNEAALIEKEITIRQLRLTNEVLETRRSIARWIALSIGIINPGESRLSAVAVLDAMMNFQFVKNYDPSYKEISEYVNVNWEEMNEKTLRYHLLRMKKMGLLQNNKGRFYFAPPEIGERYDVNVWAQSLFKAEHNAISDKIAHVVKELKTKN